MRKNRIVNASVMINLIALTLSVLSLAFTIADLFDIDKNTRILVATGVSAVTYFVASYFVKETSDCTKAWDDEED